MANLAQILYEFNSKFDFIISDLIVYIVEYQKSAGITLSNFILINNSAKKKYYITHFK
jgi:hypothetical protein